MCCASKKEVERILSLNRWEFPGYRVRADRWMCSSGTSNVVGRRGLIWVKVKRILIHLRSDAVLRDISRCLGERADFVEVGCSLNEIRVRVDAATNIPDGIWLQFQAERFWLPVVKEEEDIGFRSGKGQLVVTDREEGEVVIPISRKEKEEALKISEKMVDVAAGKLRSTAELEGVGDGEKERQASWWVDFSRLWEKGQKG
ncbi:hypothetical protein LINPERHAP2_LOCUS10653 [Linum perenne]